MKDDYILTASFDTTTNEKGGKCFSLKLDRSSVFLIELRPVEQMKSHNLALDFEESLRASNNVLPSDASMLSFERGVSPEKNRSNKWASPGPAWKDYMSDLGHEMQVMRAYMVSILIQAVDLNMTT